MRGAFFALSIVLALAGVGFAAPSANPPPEEIANRVRIGHVRVGGMTAEPARARVRAAFERPLRFAFHKQRWKTAPLEVGAQAAVGPAVVRALAARPGSRVRLGVEVNERKLRRYVVGLDRKLSFPAKNSELAGFSSGLQPLITTAKPGQRVAREVMMARIRRALERGSRKPIRLVVRQVQPEVTEANFGPVIVIRRTSRQLVLFQGERPWRTFPVAVGQPKYPTPLGNWQIVTLQRNPWWIPPASDWAKGLKPVPPGPGNPLGTRWMGLDAAGVGIHATPDAASVGYSASHGCIRMYIADAEWLFEQVRIGTPVYIAAA
jgi:lipoprotein-anchoring transpeptidase ErfK/SrfK